MDAAMNRVLTGLMLAALVSLSGCDDAPNRALSTKRRKLKWTPTPMQTLTVIRRAVSRSNFRGSKSMSMKIRE